jgi:ABC-type Zn uptake system ZnuABC Zn-binding protein ZnuA
VTRRRLVRAALLATLLWTPSAGPAAGEDGRPKVAATIFPLYDIARQVARLWSSR